MLIKKFNQYKINENILDEDEDDDSEGYERKWEVKVDGDHESFWEYKHDAIDSIVEILDTQGDETGLSGFQDDEQYEMSTSEISDMLSDLDESEFYDKLDELKEFVGYDSDIKLINIDDDDEIEFLEK